ncbi:hypothetical protein JCM3766R1_000173 [Sporobolomyces carnicolor]
MTRERHSRSSLESSSETSSFDSNEQLSDLEEAEDPRRVKKEKRTWVMRSGPSRSKSDSQKYTPVADDDDQYAGDQPSDGGDYDDAGTGGDDYSTAEKGRKKSSSAASSGQGQGAGDFSDASGDEDGQYDDQTAKEKSTDGQSKKGGSKKIWLWVGIAAVVLLLILLGIYFFWLRSKPSDSDSGKTSSSASSSNSTPSAASSPSSDLHAIPSTSAQPATTAPVSNGTVAASAAVSAAASPITDSVKKPVASSSARVTATTTATAQDSATTFFAQITWFNDEDVVTPCGSNPNDGDYVVRVSQELYGDPDSVSSVCGKWISLYQLETDSYTKATIEGICTDCVGNNLDLSRATFWAMTQNMKLGTTLAQWWWTRKEDRPQNTLESEAVPAAQKTSNPKSAQGESLASNSNSTTPASSSTHATANSGFEPVDSEETASEEGSASKGASEMTP